MSFYSGLLIMCNVFKQRIPSAANEKQIFLNSCLIKTYNENIWDRVILFFILKLWVEFLTYIFELLTFSKTTVPKLKCWIQWIEQVVGSSPVLAATPNFFCTKSYGPQKSQIIDFFLPFFETWFFFLKN